MNLSELYHWIWSLNNEDGFDDKIKPGKNAVPEENVQLVHFDETNENLQDSNLVGPYL